LDASHRKTHGAEGRAGKTAGAERDPTTGNVVRDSATNKIKGRSREMGLGSCSTVSLAEARDRAAECRKLREQEIDPIEARETARRQRETFRREDPFPDDIRAQMRIRASYPE
jgi:Arm DNA-binding domain